MKRINIIYRVTTGLFCAFMLMSGVMNVIASPESQEVMAQLGFGPHLSVFLGVAKILGVIALLTPGYPRLKERAYAGFTFDIIGAGYSFRAINAPLATWAPFIAIPLALLAASYISYHNRLRALSKNSN